MPAFNFTSPDGKSYTVNGPEGATKEQAFQILQSQLKAGTAVAGPANPPTPATTPPPPVAPTAPAGPSQDELAAQYGGGAGDNILKQAYGGFKHGLDRAAMGVKDIFTDLTPEDKALLEQGKAYLKQTGPASTVGNIGFNVALGAPAAVMTGGASLPAQMAAQGLTSALTTPGSLEERAQSGAVDALSTGAGGVLTKTLARGAKPVGDIPDNIKLLQSKGVEPTAGQIARAHDSVPGKAFSYVEDVLASVPGIGHTVEKQRGKALDQWRAAMREGAMPPLPKGLPGGSESVTAIKKAFNSAYDDVLSKQPISPAIAAYNPTSTVTNLYKNSPVTKAQANEIEKITKSVLEKHLTTGSNASALHAAESELKQIAKDFAGSQVKSEAAYGRAMRAVADDFAAAWRGGLPPDAAATLKQIDKQYAAFKPLQHAAKTGSVKHAPDDFTPAEALQSLRRTDKSPDASDFIAGKRPQQDLARAGEDALGSKVGSKMLHKALSTAAMAATGMAAPATLVAAPLYGSRAVQQYLTGRAFPKTQQALLEAIRKLVPYGAAGAGGVSRSEEE